MPPKVPSRPFAIVGLAIAGILLSLTGCRSSRPKPTHEIGHVEYDKIVDWRELVTLGPKSRQKYLGKTLTFTNMVSRGRTQENVASPNSCAEAFDLLFWPRLAADEKDGKGQIPKEKLTLHVYFNFGSEVTHWIANNFPYTTKTFVAGNNTFPSQELKYPETDRFITEVTVDRPILVKETICDSCEGATEVIEHKGQTGAVAYQGVDECLLESRALHITGKVVGVKAMDNTIMIIPTGMSW